MYLPGWRYRRKVTISHENIDADLTHFPLLLKLGSSVGLTSANVTSIFDKVSTNSKKIALTKGDGISQIYGEIERWDAANKLSELWTSKNDLVIPSSADTDLYIYYDNSHADNTAYIGDVAGSSPATNVWDAIFKMVQHMKEDPSGVAPQMKDSTSNGNNGTSNGGMTSDDSVEGKVGKALDFDGTDDYVGVSSSASLKPTEAITIEAWIRPNLQGTREFVATKWLGFSMELSTSNGAKCSVYVDGEQRDTPSTSALPNNTWTHLVFTYDSGSKSLKTYVNGGQEIKSFILSGLTTYSMTVSDNALGIGKHSSFYWNGLIDEVRISNTARSAAWIKANYHSMTDHLVTWGEEEECILRPKTIIVM